jgi:hypothetical protein
MGCRPMAMVLMRVHNINEGSKKFKSGGLHEKHAVGTWSLGNHLSIRLYERKPRKTCIFYCSSLSVPDFNLYVQNL